MLELLCDLCWPNRVRASVRNDEQLLCAKCANDVLEKRLMEAEIDVLTSMEKI